MQVNDKKPTSLSGSIVHAGPLTWEEVAVIRRACLEPKQPVALTEEPITKGVHTQTIPISEGTSPGNGSGFPLGLAAVNLPGQLPATSSDKDHETRPIEGDYTLFDLLKGIQP